MNKSFLHSINKSFHSFTTESFRTFTNKSFHYFIRQVFSQTRQFPFHNMHTLAHEAAVAPTLYTKNPQRTRAGPQPPPHPQDLPLHHRHSTPKQSPKSAWQPHDFGPQEKEQLTARVNATKKKMANFPNNKVLFAAAQKLRAETVENQTLMERMNEQQVCPRCPRVGGPANWKGGEGSAPPSRAPSLRPATVPLTASVSFEGICNRQYPPPTASATSSNRLPNRCWGRL